MEANLRFKIVWTSLIVGRKLTVFALFYFVFEDHFQVQALGGLIFGGGDLTAGFLRYEFGGLYWEGLYMEGPSLFSEFYGISQVSAFHILFHRVFPNIMAISHPFSQDHTLIFLYFHRVFHRSFISHFLSYD